MTQLWAWEYEGKTEVGFKSIVDNQELFAVPDWSPLGRRTTYQVHNLRKVKVVDEDVVTNDAVCPCFGCQCEPNQVTKDAIEEARNRNE